MKHFIKQKLRAILYILLSLKPFLYEFWCVIYDKSSKMERLEAQILISVHSLEKGMGIRNTRLGYGRQKAENVLNYLNEYLSLGYSTESYAFCEAIAILESYIEFNSKNEFQIDSINFGLKNILDNLDEKTLLKIKNYKAGAYFVAKQKFLDATYFDFQEFILSRHSIRDYSEEIVPKDTIIKAIEIANLAPSACNRQPIKVYCTTDEEQSKYVDSLITGSNGFKNQIHNFMIITSNRRAFFGGEQFQWYLNGGIYLSFLTLALHSLGIGSCIMQWFPFYKTEKALKRFFGIKRAEAIVAIIAFGYYKSENKCIYAQRKNADETISFLNSNYKTKI
ncbi:nitroreductase family protein [Gallibacterium sp. ZY190522]